MTPVTKSFIPYMSFISSFASRIIKFSIFGVLIFLISIATATQAAEIDKHDLHTDYQRDFISKDGMAKALIDALDSSVDLTEFDQFLSYPKDQSIEKLQKSFLTETLKTLVKFRLQTTNIKFIAWFAEAEFTPLAKNFIDVKEDKESHLTDPELPFNINTYFMSLVDSITLNRDVSGDQISRKISSVFKLINKNSDVGFYPSDEKFFQGLLYELGYGVSEDKVKAGSIFRDCALQGNSFCHYGLTRLLLVHQANDDSFAAGLTALEETAKKGNPLAQYELAKILYYGSTKIPVNEKKSFELFFKASRYIPTATWWVALANKTGHKFEVLKSPKTLSDIGSSDNYISLIKSGDFSPELIYRAATELSWLRIKNTDDEVDSAISYSNIQYVRAQSTKIFSYLSEMHPLSLYALVWGEDQHTTSVRFSSPLAALSHARYLAASSPYIFDRYWTAAGVMLEAGFNANNADVDYFYFDIAHKEGNVDAAYVLVAYYYDANDDDTDYRNRDKAIKYYKEILSSGAVSEMKLVGSKFSLAQLYIHKDKKVALDYLNSVIDHPLILNRPGYNKLAPSRDIAISEIGLDDLNGEAMHKAWLLNASYAALKIVANGYAGENNRGYSFYLKHTCENLIQPDSYISDQEIWSEIHKHDSSGKYGKECLNTILPILKKQEEISDLAELYWEGIPNILSPDLIKAHDYLYQNAAIKKLPNGMNNLGYFYQQNSDLVPEVADVIKGDFFWYESAAHQDHPLGTRHLGLKYLNGDKDENIKINVKKGIKLIEKALMLGEVGFAGWDLGREYFHGNRVKKDYLKARSLLEASYEASGDFRSGALLAELYEKGLGTPINLKKALRLYNSVVEDGINEIETFYRIRGKDNIDAYEKSKEGIKRLNNSQKLTEIDLGNYVALVIGNTNYEHHPVLRTPKKDAQEIARILKQNFGFKVQVVLDGDRRTILNKLNEYETKLNKNDNFLLYYAGHGIKDDETNSSYWLPVNADETIDTEWIDHSTINKKLKKFDAKNILVVADSCFAAGMIRGVIDPNKSPKNNLSLDSTKRSIQAAENSRSRILLTSGNFQPVSDSNGISNHSIFAESLINVLKKQRIQKVVSALTIHSEVQKLVINATSDGRQQSPQYNTLIKSGHLDGDFLFRKIQN